MNIKCQWDFIMGKCPSVNFDIVMTYKRRGIRAQKINDMLCGVFNSDMCQIGQYIKANQPLPKHAFIEIVNTTKVHRRT